MNLPNKLTVLRVILIPFFLLFVLLFKIPHHMVFALIVFAAASITDWFDGKIARKPRENGHQGGREGRPC